MQFVQANAAYFALEQCALNVLGCLLLELEGM